ncbi:MULTISPECIES: DUF2069 domain-containing protein [Halomonas]|uniref:DUF2069 domain-containing protein n=1 Tax=Halomonas casei TaxID=2742613 RepID=A0ABR9F1Z8_9GAMM|nr:MULTISPECIES: DUF2069 domain-containing protein [Halomonas]MBE0400497.1 DUF2069 domain-containing protein [Halomonas casei]PCC22555.1 hypothetical protein CIK78_11090 [Halomonas sp. JB37]
MRQWLEDIEARHGLDKLTLKSRQLVLISSAILLVLVIYRSFLVQGDEFNWRPVVAFVLPLVLFLPSIIGRRARGHAWLAFVSLLYFTQGVMLASVPGQSFRGISEAIVSLALFAGCMGYARFRSRQLRQK